MTPSEIDRIVDLHYAGESAKDVEATLSTMTVDCVHEVAGGPQPSRGHGEIEAFYRDLFAHLTIHEMQTVQRLYGEEFVVDDSVARCTAVGRPFGLEGGGREISFRILHVFELRDGKIHRERAWLDMASITAQLTRTAA